MTRLCIRFPSKKKNEKEATHCIILKTGRTDPSQTKNLWKLHMMYIDLELKECMETVLFTLCNYFAVLPKSNIMSAKIMSFKLSYFL